MGGDGGKWATGINGHQMGYTCNKRAITSTDIPNSMPIDY